MLLLSGAIFAMWFFVSLYLQQVRGYSPIGTGLAFVPQTIAIVFGAQVSSRLVVRLGPRPLLVVGGLCSAGGLLWLGGLGVDTGYWSGFFLPSVLVTLGLGLSFTPLAFAATAGVPPQEAGLASGLVNTSRQIGGAVGLAALATVATTRLDDLVARGRTDGRSDFGVYRGVPDLVGHRARGGGRRAVGTEGDEAGCGDRLGFGFGRVQDRSRVGAGASAGAGAGAGAGDRNRGLRAHASPLQAHGIDDPLVVTAVVPRIGLHASALLAVRGTGSHANALQRPSVIKAKCWKTKG